MLASLTGSKCFLEYKLSGSQYIKAAESLSKCNQMKKRKQKQRPRHGCDTLERVREECNENLREGETHSLKDLRNFFNRNMQGQAGELSRGLCVMQIRGETLLMTQFIKSEDALDLCVLLLPFAASR